MEEKIDINPIPYLTWTWLKINKDSVSYDFSLSENQGLETQIPEGIKINSGKTVTTSLSEPEYSIGQAAVKLISDAATEGKIYTIEKSCEKPLIIRIDMDKNSASHQIIHVKEGCSANVIILYQGGSDEKTSLSGVLTKVYAEEGSKLHISKVQLCAKGVNQIDDTAVVSDYSNLSIEHVLPQTPNDNSQWLKDFTELEREKWTHNIANLIIISGRKNSSLSNLDFSDKKEKLAHKIKDVFKGSSEILKENEWTTKTLENRLQNMIDKLFD